MTEVIIFVVIAGLILLFALLLLFTSDANEPIQQIISELDDIDPVKRAKAAYKLFCLGVAAKEALPKLSQLGNDPNVIVQKWVKLAIRSIKQEASTNISINKAIINKLDGLAKENKQLIKSRIDDFENRLIAEIIPSIKAGLLQSDVDLQNNRAGIAAILEKIKKATGNINDLEEDEIDEIIALIKSNCSKSRIISLELLMALTVFNKFKLSAAQVKSQLATLLKDKHGVVRLIAASVLIKFSEVGKGLQTIIKEIKNDDVEIRLLATEMLGNFARLGFLDDYIDDVITVLTELQSDSDHIISFNAKTALQRIELAKKRKSSNF